MSRVEAADQSEATIVVTLANWRPRMDCVSIGTTSDTLSSEAGWAHGQIVRQMRGGGSFLSSTQLPDKNLTMEHELQPSLIVEFDFI